jgi:hypothetical protein
LRFPLTGKKVIIKDVNKNVENMQVLGLLCMMCAAPAFEDTQHWFLLVVTGNLKSYSYMEYIGRGPMKEFLNSIFSRGFWA